MIFFLMDNVKKDSGLPKTMSKNPKQQKIIERAAAYVGTQTIKPEICKRYQRTSILFIACAVRKFNTTIKRENRIPVPSNAMLEGMGSFAEFEANLSKKVTFDKKQIGGEADAKDAEEVEEDAQEEVEEVEEEVEEVQEVEGPPPNQFELKARSLVQRIL